MKCLKPDYKNQTWGENARPFWLCITALDPRPGRGGRKPVGDFWDYDDDQISRYHQASILRRFVPGMPWLFINGNPGTPEWVGKNCPFSWATMLIEIRSKGAVSWDGPEGFFEFEIRLDNLEEAAQFVKDHRGRKEQEAREIHRRQSQARAQERKQANEERYKRNRKLYESREEKKKAQDKRYRDRRREREGRTLKTYYTERVKVIPGTLPTRGLFSYQGETLNGKILSQKLNIPYNALKNYWGRGQIEVDGKLIPRS